jgi:site-specific DNA-methyltransferase (adenine-specific)
MLFDDLLSMKGSHVSFILYNENCLDVLKRLEDNSLDSIVTDPPYGLSFMGKKWDYDVPSVEIWAECLRVLKPGGHLLAFAGTRTQHRMAVRIEDAGFEIRDMIAWVYGSGFPKSHDVSKAIDKQVDAERKVVGTKIGLPGYHLNPHDGGEALGHGLSSSTYETRLKSSQITAPATEAAQQWQGWGTALKPALEPITVARKPLIGTVADNVLEHGTGGLNIDGCRVATEDKLSGGHASGGQQMTGGWERPWMKDPDAVVANAERSRQSVAKAEELGRWPANLIHDGSDEVVWLFPDGGAHGGKGKFVQHTWGDREPTEQNIEPSKGSAARFFYCAKSSKRDRDEGLEGFEAKATAFGNQAQAELKRGNLDHDDGKSGMNKVKMRQNSHPTVKPTDLMRYLCRLVTPPGGVVLDPFMGSGSTGKAAMIEGFQFIGCEMSPEYFEIAKARIEAAKTEPTQKDMFVIPK